MNRPRPGAHRAETDQLDATTGTSSRTGTASHSIGLSIESLSSDSRREGHAWLAAALGAAAVVAAAYLSVHTHPAYEGGLYVEMAEAVRQNGFALPERIDGYTAGGIPFAYPPLLFYAMAALVGATGVDPVALELFGPGLVSIACLVPYYGVAGRLLPTRRMAGLATVLYAVTPAVLQWQLSAGGIVRAPAMFLTLSGLYTGIRLFEGGGRVWLVASTALFGLVLLAHPVYAAFFGLSYLVLFVALDRSVRGWIDGAAVAIGGLLVTAPWWLAVVDVHGLDVFVGVSGTRTTIGGGVSRVAEQFGYPIAALDPITPFYAAAFAGGIYALHRRRFLLPTWLVVASYGLGEDRFTFVAGSMLAAMLVLEVVLPRAVDRFTEATSGAVSRRAASGLVLVVVIVGASLVGAAYAGSALNTAYERSTTMPQTVSPADREAMAWAAANTPGSADFVVVGDAAEWFPHYAGRSILVSPWGTEWTSSQRFHRHLRVYTDLSTCHSATCLERSLVDVRGDGAFVYVPKREYTVRGREYEPPRDLVESLDESARYVRRYENEGVVIFAVGTDSVASQAIHDDVPAARPSVPTESAVDPPRRPAAGSWSASARRGTT